MTSRYVLVLLALAGVLLGTPAAARDLVRLLETKLGSVILLDRESIEEVETLIDGSQRQAVVSIDNSRARGGARFYAADVKVRVACPGEQLTIIWSRIYDHEGAVVHDGSGPAPHGFTTPRNLFERTVFTALCEGR